MTNATMTSSTMKPANDNRPADFDAKVVAEIKALRRFACRFPKSIGREDLVQDTLLEAFQRHQSYKGDKKLRTWLFYIMRNIAYLKRVNEVPVAGEKALAWLQTAATQEGDLAAQDIIRMVAIGPHSETVSLLAAGNTMQEAAEQLGITKQAVSLRLAAFRRHHEKAA